MLPAELDADCMAFTKTDSEHAQDNADKVAAQRKAAQAAATIILSILIALVGL
jgi:hypothetical protein